MGVVVAFGVPSVRVRRKKPWEYCEVTVLPGRVNTRLDLVADDHLPPVKPEMTAPKGVTPRKRTTK